MDLEIAGIRGLPPELRLGRQDLDHQHAGMFERLASLSKPGSLDETRGVVFDLLRYTREHFLAEEMFMEGIGYPALVDHRELHDNLLKELVRLASRNLGVPDAQRDFQVFVQKWLVEHIQMADRKIVAFLEARGDSTSG
jgi:hemerythrin